MIFVGDIHGNPKNVIEKMTRLEIQNEILIQVGDFGRFEGDDLFITELDEFLRVTNNEMKVLRGNHDNPNDWLDNPSYTNIQFVGDYDVQEIECMSVMFVGGGVSVDRERRKEGVSWWKNEIIKNPTQYDLELMKTIDIMVSHVPIKKMYNHVLCSRYNESRFSSGVQKDLYIEQRLLENIYFLTTDKLKYWVSGHMHNHGKYVDLNGANFYFLGIDDLIEVKND